MNTMESSRADAPLVLILGLGESGVAAARWCARQGARLRVADTRAEPGGLAVLREALAQSEVEFRLGCDTSFDVALLDGVSQVVISPAWRPDSNRPRRCWTRPPRAASRSWAKSNCSPARWPSWPNRAITARACWP